MSLACFPRPGSSWAKHACLILMIAGAPAAALAANTSPSTPAATSFASLLQVLFGLGLVLAAIGGTAWLLRRLGPHQTVAAGALRVVGGVVVGPKERVILVDVGDTRLVIGVTPGHISTLHQMPRPAEEAIPASTSDRADSFYQRLREALHRKGGA